MMQFVSSAFLDCLQNLMVSIYLFTIQKIASFCSAPSCENLMLGQSWPCTRKGQPERHATRNGRFHYFDLPKSYQTCIKRIQKMYNDVYLYYPYIRKNQNISGLSTWSCMTLVISIPWVGVSCFTSASRKDIAPRPSLRRTPAEPNLV